MTLLTPRALLRRTLRRRLTHARDRFFDLIRAQTDAVKRRAYRGAADIQAACTRNVTEQAHYVRLLADYRKPEGTR